MTEKESKFIADTIHKYLGEILKPLNARLKSLEREVDDLRAKGVSYMGIFQRALEYSKGDIITHQGSAWISLVDKNNTPPGDNEQWQLMVKHGRDGRDAR